MLKANDFIFCIIAASFISLGYMCIDIYLPALPLLKHYFATSTAGIQSTLTIYLIGTCFAYLIMGPLADHVGFRQLLLTLCIILIIGSIVCAMAHNLWMLYIGRFIQAMCAGGLGVVGRGSFMKYFPKEQALRIFIAIVPSVAVMSPALAPTIGSLLVHHFAWQSVFAFIALLAGLFFILSYKFYQLPAEEKKHTSLHPIYIIKTYYNIISNPKFILNLAIPFILFLLYFYYAAEMPFIMHHAGFGPRGIGLSFIPLAIGFFSSAQIASRLTKRWSKQKIVLLGLSTMLFGLLLFLVLSLTINNIIISFVLPTFFYLGAMGFVNPVVMGECIAMFPNNTGYASSLTGTVGILGGAIGSQTVNLITHGNVLYLAYSMLTLLAAVIVVFAISTRFQK